jgi:hypothetical protein
MFSKSWMSVIVSELTRRSVSDTLRENPPEEIVGGISHCRECPHVHLSQPSPKPVTLPALNASFTYDGDGKRVKSTINGTTTYFVGAHYEVSGLTITKYFWDRRKQIRWECLRFGKGLCGAPCGPTLPKGDRRSPSSRCNTHKKTSPENSRASHDLSSEHRRWA